MTFMSNVNCFKIKNKNYDFYTQKIKKSREWFYDYKNYIGKYFS